MFNYHRRTLLLMVLTVLVSSLEFAPRASSQGNSNAIDANDANGVCHMRIANYLLHGNRAQTESCRLIAMGEVRSMEPDAKTLLAIAELQLALDVGVDSAVQREEILFEQAAAYIRLSGQYDERADYERSTRSLDSSASIYLALFDRLSVRVDFAETVPRIVAGLLRCGRLSDALSMLEKLPEGNSAREYLTAEILFSRGNRRAAALGYEKWLASGCTFDEVMLMNDEFGLVSSRWLLSRPINQTRCEQIPLELVTRLDSLNRWYGHPANLPKRRFPAIIVRDFAR